MFSPATVQSQIIIPFIVIFWSGKCFRYPVFFDSWCITKSWSVHSNNSKSWLAYGYDSRTGISSEYSQLPPGPGARSNNRTVKLCFIKVAAACSPAGPILGSKQSGSIWRARVDLTSSNHCNTLDSRIKLVPFPRRLVVDGLSSNRNVQNSLRFFDSDGLSSNRNVQNSLRFFDSHTGDVDSD